jgi:uncharacterized membrane protein
MVIKVIEKLTFSILLIASFPRKRESHSAKRIEVGKVNPFKATQMIPCDSQLNRSEIPAFAGMTNLRLWCKSYFAILIFCTGLQGFSFATIPLDEPPKAINHPPIAGELPENLDLSHSSTSSSSDVYGVVQKILKDGTRFINGQNERYQKLLIQLDESVPGTTPSLPSTQQTTQVIVENDLGDNPAYQIHVKPGSRVLLSKEISPNENIPKTSAEQAHYNLIGMDRTPGLWILLTISILALLVIGGQYLARTVAVWLLFSFSAWNFLLPLIVSGNGAAWLVLGFLCFLFPLAMNNLHRIDTVSNPDWAHHKQSICNQAVWAGTVVQFAILWVMHSTAQLDGHTSVNLNELWELHPQTSYWVLYVSGTILGFQGFLYALCYRTTESLSQENIPPTLNPSPSEGGGDTQLHLVKENNLFKFNKDRFWAVFHLSRQKLVPILITLGFLSTCSSLPIMLEAQQSSLAQFINQESVSSAITFILSGCLNLLLTIPILAFLVARNQFKVK